MKKFTAILLVLILISTSVLLAGCVKLPGINNVIQTSDGSLTITSKGITIQGDDGSVTTIGGAELPAGWPSSTLPVIAGATLSSSSKTTNDKGDVFSVIFTTKKTFAEVAKYYEDIAKGFTESQNFNSADLATFAGKKDGYEIYILVSGGDEITCSLTLTKY